ncbi:hypothetical protein [Bacillus infantis]|uniref:Uncharacterized protein n=1 Tax=Bacillus infantis TaxID=324767 RepID=A0A5D4RH08_9BACI|nr:hypothetical protein [Bacillus infantis]TYS50099.1 hypothetical protein FZD51_05980 [Bacillus infantis]
MSAFYFAEEGVAFSVKRRKDTPAVESLGIRRCNKLEIKRDPETEVFINSMENSNIYFFMRDEFDRTTNYGESYNPEVHDLLVVKSAAEKFSISELKADKIYIDFESAITEFHSKRPGK